MIIRVVEATAHIPKGYTFEADSLEVGGVIEREVLGTHYYIPIEKIELLGGNRLRVSNSNLVAVVEVFNG
jgi:hypothetical protein